MRWGKFSKAISFPVFLGVLLVAGAFVQARPRLADPDLWWHLVAGEQILQTGRWPTADPYSFTVSGHDWIAYSWLGEVLMALTARLGHLPALTALLIALSAILLVLLYYHCYLRCRNVKAAFVACALLLPVAAVFFTLRPQLLGYIFLLLTLICLERFRQERQKRLWLLPGVFLAWVNTHGTFTLGLLVLGVYWVSGLVGFQLGGVVAERWTAEQRRHLLVTFLLCVLVLPLTPYGTRLAAYPLQMSFSQPLVTTEVEEWQPLASQPLLEKVLVVWLLLFLLAQVLFRPSYRLEEMGLLVCAAYAAFLHARFLLLFVLVFAPLLAALLARWIPGYQPAKDRYVLNVALMVLVAAGMVRFFPSRDELECRVAQSFPQKAVDNLRQHPVGGPMLNEFDWGGYLIWSLGPAHKVFIDGRGDIYEYSGVLSDYLRIMRLDPDALELLKKYGVDACLLRRAAPLGTLLETLPDWKKVYWDELSVLFVHKRRQG